MVEQSRKCLTLSVDWEGDAATRAKEGREGSERP